MNRKPRGGVGSNQYATRGTSTQPSPAARAAITAAVSAEGSEARWAEMRDALDRGETLNRDEWETVVRGDWAAWQVRAAQREDCPPDLLDELVTNGLVWTAECAVKNPSCPPATLARVIRGTDDTLALYAVQNPSCPSAVIIDALNAGTFNRGTDWWDDSLFEAAAKNEHLDPQVHVLMTKRGIIEHYATAVWAHPDVLRAVVHSVAANTICDTRVAENYNADADLLDELSRRRSLNVRHAVAGNPNTSSDTLRRLGKSNSSYVLGAVALNHGTPSDVLERVWNVSDRLVQSFVERNPSCPPQLKVAGAFH